MSLAATLRRKAGGFAGKSFASLLVKVGGAFASYVFFLAFARTLGPVAFGVFAFILSAANFGMLAASFGQPMLTLRNLSYALAADREAVLENPMFTILDQPGIGRYPVAASPLQFGAVPRRPPKTAPVLGQHTDEILSDILGLPGSEIARLHDEKVVGGPR